LAASRPRAELPRRDPIRHPLRRLLLEERAAREPLAPALHRERTILQMRDDPVGDTVVVAEEVALRDPVVGEEHAVGARELHLMGHVRTAHITLARFGIAYDRSSGRSSRKRARSAARSSSGRLAIKLLVPRVATAPDWVCTAATVTS